MNLLGMNNDDVKMLLNSLYEYEMYQEYLDLLGLYLTLERKS